MTKLKSGTLLALAFASAAYAAEAGQPDLVMVGDPGNASHDGAFDGLQYAPLRGSVDHPFRMGRREVSNADYAVFLNAWASRGDARGLFDERMAIARSPHAGGWHHAAAPGAEHDGVAYVSKISAARYCNFLTTGDPARGAYRIERRTRQDGSEHEVIVGHRDLTFPDEARIYMLPDLHEFIKAGWYDGKGGYQKLAQETRRAPSRYGLENHAAGLREWMDNKYRRGATFAIGAGDADNGEAAINAASTFQMAEQSANAATGFRVAATAPLQIGDRLNRHNNFFWQGETSATLRVRLDGAARRESFRVSMRDFAGHETWARNVEAALRPGVTEIPLPLPAADGYYELSVAPGDATFAGRGVTIPLAIMNTPMPSTGLDGNFGLTCHVTRNERGYNYEPYDFDLLKRLGVSHVRMDVSYDGVDGSHDALRRIRKAGLNPLAIISRTGLRSPEQIKEAMESSPELVAKWIRHGIPAEFAWHAEQVWRLVEAHKDVVRDWEFVNEPTYIRIPAEDYAQALKAAYVAAKLADPGCNLMAGDLNVIHAPVLQLNGGAFCDSVATHIYGFYVPSFWGLAGKMRELNGWMVAAGIAKKPVWITEIANSTYNSRFLLRVRTLDETRRYHALHQPKAMAGGLAFGAARVLPYNFRDVPVDTRESMFGMIDRHGLPKAAAMSFRTTAILLGQAGFEGFMKGHSFANGRIAGLAFRDPEERDVLVLWRNDDYSRGRFDIPFENIIRPPESIAVRSRSPRAELFNLAGGASTLNADAAGRLSIPVSEYPVFVRGRLAPELEAVSIAHDVPPIDLSRVRVKILNNEPERACDLMAGVTLRLTEKTRAPVEVRVYNIADHPVEGTLRLVPLVGWREWPRQVTPAAVSLSIPAHGMGTARFEIPVPARDKDDQLHFLNAVFADGTAAAFQDTVVLRPQARSIPLSDWRTYARGFRLEGMPGDAGIRIAWESERAKYASLYLRRPPPFAASAAELERAITLTYEPDGAGVRAVSLLFRDRDNETFQIRKIVPPHGADEQPDTIRFEAGDILRPGVIIHAGGDGQVDFPVRLLGFNFDLTPERDDGGIIVRPVDLGDQAGEFSASPLGGVEDGTD